MKLPVIKTISEFIDDNDPDFVSEAIEVLEHVSASPSLSDDELEVIGELISNMCGALEVSEQVRSGVPKKDALNQFMGRVLGSIDK